MTQESKQSAAPVHPAPPAPSAPAPAARTRKPMSWPIKPEQKPHRANSKRAKVIELTGRPQGATFAEIQAATGWDDRNAYEGVKLLHSALGYGLAEPTLGGPIYLLWPARPEVPAAKGGGRKAS